MPMFPHRLALAALLLAGGYTLVQPNEAARATTPADETFPFLGGWELDLTRMPDTYGPPPKRVIYRFEDAGAGQWRTRIEITAPDNSVRHIAVTYRRDGRAVQGEGDNTDGDSAAFTSPAPNVLVMNVGQNKSYGAVRVYVVSPDGKEMTEAASGITQDGAPFVRNFHYKRIR